ESKVQAVIDKWKSLPGWSRVYGAVPFCRLIAKHPARARITDELFAAVMDSVEGAFEAANSQIRDTRKAYEIAATAHGLLLLVNEDVWFLNPEGLRVKLCQLWAKRRQGGARFAYVDWAIVVTAAHTVMHKRGEMVPTLSLSAPHRERDAAFE